MVSGNSQRIARNTIFLYIRTLFSQLIALYTSRKILEILGVEDYGIYNVVGGVVSMLTFFNGSMAVATQRIIRKTKCSGISEQNVPFPKRNVPL